MTTTEAATGADPNRLQTWLGRGWGAVEPSSLAAFRILFGLIASIGALRFLIYGWVDRFYERPGFFFHYHGFEWVRPLPHPWNHVLFGALAVLGLFVALGFFYRASIVVFFFVFTYVELIDVSGYLNHYYLVSLLALWMCFLPLGDAYSLDARRRKFRREIPLWALRALRLQVACVYFYAAIAKATGDWLWHGQPLEIWLAARTDVPLVGWLSEALGLHTLALLAGWAGFLHDLLIVPALLWKRTRPYAFGALLGFHLATHYLFNIGMFPLIMTCAATVFLSPAWPRRWLERLLGPSSAEQPSRVLPSRPFSRFTVAALVLLGLSQVLVPLRAFAYGGNVLWHEQGMRFSWRVMCREKNGSVRYRVRRAPGQREVYVSPGRYLTDFQEREMSSQPDLILQLAHRVGRDMAREDGNAVEVRVDALVSLNGRRAQRLIDPDVDLMSVEDGHMPASWILPGPTGPPHRF